MCLGLLALLCYNQETGAHLLCLELADLNVLAVTTVLKGLLQCSCFQWKHSEVFQPYSCWGVTKTSIWTPVRLHFFKSHLESDFYLHGFYLDSYLAFLRVRTDDWTSISFNVDKNKYVIAAEKPSTVQQAFTVFFLLGDDSFNLQYFRKKRLGDRGCFWLIYLQWELPQILIPWCSNQQ